MVLLWASAWNATRALGGEPVRCAGAAASQELYVEWGRAYEAPGGVRMVPGVVQRLQLVAMEPVLAVGRHMKGHSRRGHQQQAGQVRSEGNCDSLPQGPKPWSALS
jgi:hypothetical protein